MIFKLIFLMILCIPIGYFQCRLLANAAKDVRVTKKPKKTNKRKSKVISSDQDMKRRHLKVAK